MKKQKKNYMDDAKQQLMHGSQIIESIVRGRFSKIKGRLNLPDSVTIEGPNVIFSSLSYEFAVQDEGEPTQRRFFRLSPPDYFAALDGKITEQLRHYHG